MLARSVQLCARRRSGGLNASCFQRLDVQSAQVRRFGKLGATPEGSPPLASTHHQSTWHNVLTAVASICSAGLGVAGSYAAYRYLSEPETLNTEAKRLATALKSATVSAPEGYFERPEVAAELEAALEPLAPNGYLNQTVLVTGKLCSGKSAAVREALGRKKRVAMAYDGEGEGAFGEAWCNRLLAVLGVYNHPQDWSACSAVEGGLRALKQESPKADLPILVAEVYSAVTPEQLTSLLRTFKYWAADAQLAKCLVVLANPRAALSTESTLHEMRVQSVVIGDLTNQQAVAYCTAWLQLWQKQRLSVPLTDEQLQQLASDIVKMLGTGILSLRRAEAHAYRCSSVDETLAMCADCQQLQQNAAKDAVYTLVHFMEEQLKDAGAVDRLLLQLLEGKETGAYTLLKMGLEPEEVYDANAAFIPNVLAIDPETKDMTLDTEFITEAVRQYLLDKKKRRK